jgi:hypothetical protein
VLGVAAALATGLSAAPPGAWRGELIMTAAVLVHGVLQCLVSPLHPAIERAWLPHRRHGDGAAALVLVGALTGSVAALSQFSTPQWIAGIYLGVAGGALAFILWVLALERASPTRVANTMTVNPLAAGCWPRNSSASRSRPISCWGLSPCSPGSGSQRLRDRCRQRSIQSFVPRRRPQQAQRQQRRELSAEDTIRTRLPMTSISRLNASGAPACAIRAGAPMIPRR